MNGNGSTAVKGDSIRVVLGDSTAMEAQLLADALHRSRQFGTVAAASKSSEVMALVEEIHPQVLVVSADLDGEAAGGATLVRELLAMRPDLKVVMLLQDSSKEAVVQAFRAGCRGVFCRAGSPKELVKCVVTVCAGQIWASSEELTFVLDALRDLPPLRVVNSAGISLLTKREMAVVQCAAEGLTNGEIGAQLNLSEHTVKNYMFRIFDKLGVSSRVELILYVMSQTQNHSGAQSARPDLEAGVVTGPAADSHTRMAFPR